MARLLVFNQVSLDGYFVDAAGSMSWAHRERVDEEWDRFVSNNARGGGLLVFGRITYDLMAGYWPTPMAARNDPVVAERMNSLPKIVFSRTMKSASWSNTTLLSGDPVAEMRRLKKGATDMAIMGSGSIVAQLAPKGLIDEYQIVIIPLVLGAGRTMFDGIEKKIEMRLVHSRAFANGNVVLSYEPAA